MRQVIKNGVDQVLYQDGNGGTVEIFDIVVNSGRGKGVGTELVNLVCKDAKRRGAKRVFAFTRDGNLMARKFYAKLGFSETIILNFYPDGNAVCVVKEL